MNTKKKKTEKKFITYKKAVEYLKNNIIPFDNIYDIDEDIDFRFDTFDENDEDIPIHEYYLTDCSKKDVAFLEKSFNLKFAYSSILDLYILCVDHKKSWGKFKIECLDDSIQVD